MRRIILVVAAALIIFGITACKDSGPSNTVVYEGVIYTIQWTDQKGETHGMSRLSIPESVPGRNGSFNMDLYGRLYLTHIEIMNNQAKDLGPQIIPFERIDFVQFGDGGRVFEKPANK